MKQLIANGSGERLTRTCIQFTPAILCDLDSYCERQRVSRSLAIDEALYLLLGGGRR